jgi:hypothetical protein
MLQLGLLWPCLQILRPDWKGFLSKDKCSSLFCHIINDKGKKFHNFDTRSDRRRSCAPPTTRRRRRLRVSASSTCATTTERDASSTPPGRRRRNRGESGAASRAAPPAGGSPGSVTVIKYLMGRLVGQFDILST